MAVQYFQPEIWSARLLSSLKKATVYGGVCTREYEGDIRDSGDTVRITSISRPTIGTYTKGSTTVTPEQLTDAQRSRRSSPSRRGSKQAENTPPSPRTDQHSRPIATAS